MEPFTPVWIALIIAQEGQGVTTESLIVGGIGAVLLSLAGLLLRALQTQQRASAHTLREQREATSHIVHQWQQVAEAANHRSMNIEAECDRKLVEAEARCAAEIQTLHLTINDMESQIDVLRARLNPAQI